MILSLEMIIMVARVTSKHGEFESFPRLWDFSKWGEREGCVVVEHSPGMRDGGGSIPGHVKQHKTKDVKIWGSAALLSAQDIRVGDDWPARSQDNGLGWDITAFPWCGVSVG